MTTNQIFTFLGAGRPRRLISSSFFLTIVVVFYFFVLGSNIHLTIYTLHNRVTYTNIFLTHITSLNLDIFIVISATIAWIYLSIKSRYTKTAIILFFSAFLFLLLANYNTESVIGAGLAFPAIISLIILDKFRDKKILTYDYRLAIDYVSIVTIFLTSLGIVSLLLFVITGVTTPYLEKYPYALYQELLSILTPLLMATLVFCIPLKLLLSGLLNKMKKERYAFLFDIVGDRLPTKRVMVYLSLSILLGILVILVPHIAVTNPNHERLGVDTPRYVLWLNLMKNHTSSPIQLVFKDISSGDRPLTLIILFLITEAIKVEPFQVVEYSPLFLVPLLILITFFLTRQITSNDKIGIIASFLSAVSFQTLTGIYSGFYANWLALILGYLSFALLVRHLKTPSKFTIVTLAVTMTGLLLAHIYTWTIIISVAFVFLFVLVVLNSYPRKRILILYLILSSSIAIDIIKSTWMTSSTGLVADIYVGIGHGLGITQFNERLMTLADTVQTYYGGVFANIAILGLVLYWLVRFRARELANIFVLIFLSMALIPLFLGDYVLQSRVLYNIPFQIPAAISLYAIWKENYKMVFIAILLITAYLSLHVLSNLGYVPPSSGRLLIEP